MCVCKFDLFMDKVYLAACIKRSSLSFLQIRVYLNDVVIFIIIPGS